jgi:hypothetical protein
MGLQAEEEAHLSFTGTRAPTGIGLQKTKLGWLRRYSH